MSGVASVLKAARSPPIKSLDGCVLAWMGGGVMWKLYACCAFGLAFLNVACAADDTKSAQEAVIGTWTVDTNDDYNCSRGFQFAPNGEYEFAYVCELTSGAFGYQAVVGTYDVQGDTDISLTATQATCEDVPTVPTFVKYQQVGNQLRLNFGSFAYIMIKREDDGTGGGANIVMGCYDDEGKFKQRGLSAL
jgi:hypothetical protein